MKNKSFDVSMVALLGAFILASGMFVISSVRQFGVMYKTVSPEIPATSQLAQLGVGGMVKYGELSGYAWSSTIGWISFNGANSAAGGGAYDVYISTTSPAELGRFNGHAWSPHVGWISFKPADVSGCPVDPGAVLLDGCNPAVNLSTGEVTGWARVLSLTGEPGGGWLQLSGTAHPTGVIDGTRGVTFDPGTHKFKGFAWDSGTLGWVNFDAGVPSPVILDITTPPAGTLEGTCTIPASANIPSGDSVAAVNVVINVTAGGNGGPYTPSSPVLYLSAGTHTNIPVTVTDASGPNTGVFYCGPITVTNDAVNIGLFIGPDLARANQASALVRQGNTFALRWENNLGAGYTCNTSVTNSGNWPAWTGAPVSASGNITSQPTSAAAGVARGTYTFTLNCDDADLLAPPVLPSHSASVNLRIVGVNGEEF